jgi:Tol biopolymer transport system component
MSDDRPGHEELRRRLDRLASDAPDPAPRRDTTLSRAKHRARAGMAVVSVGAVAASVAAVLAFGAIRGLDREDQPIGPTPTGTVIPPPSDSPAPTVRAEGQIAYWSGSESTEGSIERARLIIADADGSGAQDIGPAVSTSRLSWSPDGKHVVFDRRTGANIGELDTMTVPGGSPTTLLDVNHAPQDPDWSSNGTIAFATDSRALFTMRPSDVSPSAPVRELGPNRYLEGVWPTWSPEGDRIAYIDPETRRLNVVEVQGTSAPQIVLDMRTDSLDWGPDGIVAAAWDGAGWSLYLVDPAGNRSPERLTDETADEIQPSISEDGRYVAFVKSGGGGRDVYLLDRSNGLVDRLTDDPGLEFSPAWRPSAS